MYKQTGRLHALHAEERSVMAIAMLRHRRIRHAAAMRVISARAENAMNIAFMARNWRIHTAGASPA